MQEVLLSFMLLKQAAAINLGDRLAQSIADHLPVFLWCKHLQLQGRPDRGLVEAWEPPMRKEGLTVREDVDLAVRRVDEVMQACTVVHEGVGEGHRELVVSLESLIHINAVLGEVDVRILAIELDTTNRFALKIQENRLNLLK